MDGDLWGSAGQDPTAPTQLTVLCDCQQLRQDPELKVFHIFGFFYLHLWMQQSFLSAEATSTGLRERKGPKTEVKDFRDHLEKDGNFRMNTNLSKEDLKLCEEKKQQQSFHWFMDSRPPSDVHSPSGRRRRERVPPPSSRCRTVTACCISSP